MTARLEKFNYCGTEDHWPDAAVTSIWDVENDPKLGTARILVNFCVSHKDDGAVEYICTGDDGYYIADAVNLTALENGDYANAFVNGTYFLEEHADITRLPRKTK